MMVLMCMMVMHSSVLLKSLLLLRILLVLLGVRSASVYDTVLIIGVAARLMRGRHLLVLIATRLILQMLRMLLQC